MVLFDLDDTLFAHRKATEDGIVAHLEALGFNDDPLAAGRWTQLEGIHYSRYLAGELDYLGQRRARVRDFMKPHGLTFAADSDADDWFEGYSNAYRGSWTLHDDALPLLDSLTDYQLGIITNGVTEQQQRKLDRLGLSPYFQHLVTSADFGAVKPDPSIFQHAVSLFDVSPASVVYVGDRFRTDALGAVAAGLAGVWLDRASSATPAEKAEADSAGVHIIHSLDELPPLLPAL